MAGSDHGAPYLPQLADVGLRQPQPIWRQRADFIPKENKNMPNTSALPKEERKAAKRAARKKAAPKAARTTERGASKQTVKKAARGTSKR